MRTGELALQLAACRTQKSWQLYFVWTVELALVEEVTVSQPQGLFALQTSQEIWP